MISRERFHVIERFQEKVSVLEKEQEWKIGKDGESQPHPAAVHARPNLVGADKIYNTRRQEQEYIGRKPECVKKETGETQKYLRRPEWQQAPERERDN